MATDSTELTFVRCPSCRSLVPAVSSRCRMCGAGLDSGDDMAGGELQSSEAEDVAPPVEESIVASGDDSESGDSESGVEEFDDPLGDYLEDFEGVGESADAEPKNGHNGANGTASKDIDDESPVEAFFDDDFDDDLLLDEEPPPATPKKREATTAPKTKSATKLKFEPAKQKVKRGLSFERKGDSKKTSETRATETSARKRVKTEATRKRATEEHKITPRAHKGVERKDLMQEHHDNDDMEITTSPVNGKALSQEGRLFGWLVNFRNPAGEALELREGKFFVTGSQLKPSDLVLDDDGISTPHALVGISSERGLLVQDLMSERGVFVRSVEDAAYHREEETVELGHGDWIRFGDTEFLVSLVPHS